ncbi:DNA cross-link repair 1A protein, variant 2 [Bonamia ostreae]|uniref:DNA cross-link repair 1A protein, variant 2 n=1 Tax=Bonamia ostreae TaxID=126728 RepID=A0ABV2AQP5_9EUKA
MALKSIPRNKKSKKSKRTKICPEHKIIKGTNYTVDAFCYKPFDQKMVFFLSHFHTDHYKGLLKSFSEGDIYCSPITASLVLAKIGVNKKYLKPLQIGVKHKIPIKPTNQIFSKSTYSYVTLVEANHCPGSVIFFFEIPNKKVILHTGDFRFGDQLKNNPICAKNKNVSFMYLDTTYCNPRFVFPTQKKCCEYVSQNIDKLKSDSKILFVIGSYNLGKEKIFVSVFKKTELQIYVDPKRVSISLLI